MGKSTGNYSGKPKGTFTLLKESDAFRRSRLLVKIPIVINAIAISMICLSMLLERLAITGPVYSACALIGILLPVLTCTPNIFCSILGIVLAVKARKTEGSQTRPLIIIGVSGLVLAILTILAVWFLVFVVAASV